MTFVQVERNRGFSKQMIHIDGYSKAKTEKGALKDLARTIRQYNETEADCILDMIKFNEVSQSLPSQEDTKNRLDAYILEWEEVECASRYVDEELTEIEYADASWYLHIAFVQ